MTSQKVTSLSDWKNRDSLELVEHLAKRFALGDLRGLFVVSVGRDGRAKAEVTGSCKTNMESIIGTVLSMTLNKTDPSRH